MSQPADCRGRALALAGVLALLTVWPSSRTVRAQEGVFLTEAEAPAAVFSEADTFVRQVVPLTPDLRERLRTALGLVTPSLWEETYVTFKALRGDQLLGYALLVEEVGKHRPITFVVGVRVDGTVNDVAVVAYREAYGGEVKAKRFLGQYRGKSSADPLQAPANIKNIAGATLSVDAASRAVHKALALARVVYGVGSGT